MKSILKNAAILLAITLVAAVALAFVYDLTKEPIARAEQQKKVEAYQAVYTEAASFGDVPDVVSILKEYNATLTGGTAVEEIYTADAADGTRLGYVLSVMAKGYGGDVKIALGIDTTGKVVGYSVLSHSETPGFGANMENGDVAAQFIGITSADQLDGITGATYTTNALKAETQAAIDLVGQLEGGSGT
ncbi:MAG: FMN-binding protein [Clostridia bacterium]|nr:FMN-binding protein [Clostridia bacterium]